MGNTGGWNRSTANQPVKKGGAKAPSAMRGIVAGLAVAIIAGFCVFMFAGKSEKSVEKVEKKPTKIKEVTPAPAPKAVVEEPAPVVVPDSERIVKYISVETNRFDKIVRVYVTADGKKHRHTSPARPPIFDHMTDDILSTMLCFPGAGKMQMPPMPLTGNLDRDFLKSLETPIIISKDDPEDVAERKRIVREGRKQVKDLMDQGLTFKEIIADHEKLMNHNAEMREDAIRMLKEFRAEGDPEGTKQFLDSINATLEAKGIDPIPEPKTPDEMRQMKLQSQRSKNE